MNDETTYVPLDDPTSGAQTLCDGHNPFILHGRDPVWITPCRRGPVAHIGMSDQCDCCDCTTHAAGPLRWDRHTHGAMRSVRKGDEYDLASFTSTTEQPLPGGDA